MDGLGCCHDRWRDVPRAHPLRLARGRGTSSQPPMSKRLGWRAPFYSDASSSRVDILLTLSGATPVARAHSLAPP